MGIVMGITLGNNDYVSFLQKLESDGASSIDSRLDLLGIARPVCWAESL